ncbi:DUF2304 domain-containing protein [Microbacterium esteraromaticum]|uniref:DUF2304 domain-containing protein n=1 Tax=Microbacterium esteraromaticum TaxID=57043 RepID=A0A7D8AKE6_9MICO|nr:DUF2304 domain-containing protein [Microbacterium esteraromaticum]QMU97726.1 DUF2304 domain-containing protein [Microbacterium esteraromaticum]
MIAITGVVFAVVLLATVLALLLTRRLREKYAVLWIVIGLAILVLGVFPPLLMALTDLFGVVIPANLLFAMAIVLLLGVGLHLSWELSQAEDELRRAAEELAILRTEHDSLDQRVAALEERVAPHAVEDEPDADD